MAGPWWRDDDQLLSALRRAVRAASDVPAELIEAGKTLFTLRDIDAELAVLTYDSAAEGGLAAARADHELTRALIFAAPDLTIELELGQGALFGQIVPAESGTAEAREVGGALVTTAIDANGCFVIRPVPDRTFRVLCRSVGGLGAVTSWISP